MFDGLCTVPVMKEWSYITTHGEGESSDNGRNHENHNCDCNHNYNYNKYLYKKAYIFKYFALSKSMESSNRIFILIMASV